MTLMWSSHPAFARETPWWFSIEFTMTKLARPPTSPVDAFGGRGYHAGELRFR